MIPFLFARYIQHFNTAFLLFSFYIVITYLDAQGSNGVGLHNDNYIFRDHNCLICIFWCGQEREEPTLTEWDRFAHREYIRLSMEEDVEDVSNGSAEVWDESFEAPF